LVVENLVSGPNLHKYIGIVLRDEISNMNGSEITDNNACWTDMTHLTTAEPFACFQPQPDVNLTREKIKGV
jgi:hypothetical protein